MGRVSVNSVKGHGTRVSFPVTAEVAAALLSEAKRMKRTVEHVAAEILHTWHELDWLPLQENKTKKKPAS